MEYGFQCLEQSENLGENKPWKVDNIAYTSRLPHLLFLYKWFSLLMVLVNDVSEWFYPTWLMSSWLSQSALSNDSIPWEWQNQYLVSYCQLLLCIQQLLECVIQEQNARIATALQQIPLCYHMIERKQLPANGGELFQYNAAVCIVYCFNMGCGMIVLVHCWET